MKKEGVISKFSIKCGNAALLHIISPGFSLHKDLAIITEVIENGKKHMAAVAKIIHDDDGKSAEFSMIVSDVWQKQGIGSKMIYELIKMSMKKGVEKIYFYVLPDNFAMKKLLARFGFTLLELGDYVYAELALGSVIATE